MKENATKILISLKFFVIYYIIYGILIAFVEPFSWFGSKKLEQIGVIGHIFIITLPLFITVIYYSINYNKYKILLKYKGVKNISIGEKRGDSFEALRNRANNKIISVGVGMTNISDYALKSFEKQAKNVDIQFLMINPEMLRECPSYCRDIEDLLGIENVCSKVESSFDRLKKFCKESNKNNPHRKATLSTYNTIPTNSVTIIDPDNVNGEMIIEFFLYQSGNHRPRLHICKTPKEHDLFDVIYEQYTELFKHSKKVI